MRLNLLSNISSVYFKGIISSQGGIFPYGGGAVCCLHFAEYLPVVGCLLKRIRNIPCSIARSMIITAAGDNGGEIYGKWIS